jgi:hypothetical protein
MGKYLCEDDVKIIITGWVRCGNRWLARLLMHYADDTVENAEVFLARNYWHTKAEVTYFGQSVEIRVSHIGALSYRDIDDDTYIIHTKRDPRDAFVSWYYTLQRDRILPMDRRTWKRYLPWLILQRHQLPFHEYTDGWLALEEEDPARFLWTSHEYAKDHKAGELLRFMEGMGIRVSPERAEYAAGILDAEPERGAYKIAGAAERGISTWRQHFDAQDAWFIEQLYGDLIVRLGYDDEDWQELVRMGFQWQES